MGFENNSYRIGWALLAVLSTAALVWFGTGLFPLWPLMWFAPLPILLFAARSAWPAAAAAAMLAWALGNLNQWHYFRDVLHVPLSVCAVVVLAPACIFALTVLLFRALARRSSWWSAAIAFPAAWVSFEYLLNLSSVHGTAMNLAYSQLRFLPLLQLAAVTGPWGISFILLLFSSAAAVGILAGRQERKQALQIVVTMMSLVIGVLVFGAMRLASPPPQREVKVGLAASDLPQNRDAAAPGADTDRLLHDYQAHAEDLAARGAEVIVLPEHLGEVVDPHTAAADEIFQSLADKAGVPIVVGVSHVAPRVMYNQARIYTPRAQVLSYNKHHLLPPFESRFAPGRTLTTLTEPTGTWGVAICKDMDFTQLSRQYGRNGAGLMLVPAWDFTLDRVEHGHIAIMRGVESGFTLARAARGGYLTVSDNRGRVLGETQSNAAPFATLLVTVPVVHDNTLYLLWGDWFAWVVLALLGLVLMRLAWPRLFTH